MATTKKCPVCGQPLRAVERTTFGNNKTVVYFCDTAGCEKNTGDPVYRITTR